MKNSNLIKDSFNDKVVLNDMLADDITKGKSLFKTSITFKDYKGDKLIRVSTKRTNMTVLGGRTNILEQLFDIEPDVRKHLFLNNMMPVFPTPTVPDPTLPGTIGGSGSATPEFYKGETIGNTQEDFFKNNPASSIEEDLYSLNRHIKWCCIGNGGNSDTNPLLIHKAKNHETRLYNMVPFRLVKTSQDLAPEVRAEYGGKTLITYEGVDYYAYWFKKINIRNNVISSVVGKKNYLTTSDDSIGKLNPAHSNPIIKGAGHELENEVHLSFVTVDLTVSKHDFKEYYKITHNNSLQGANLTELGFVLGTEYELPPENGRVYTEVSYPELFAKITHDPVFMSSENVHRETSYNIYS